VQVKDVDVVGAKQPEAVLDAPPNTCGGEVEVGDSVTAGLKG
jgi:hypothetical protein